MVHGQIHSRKFQRLSAFSYNYRMVLISTDIIKKPCYVVAKVQKLFLGVRCQWLISVKSGTICNLRCDQRTDTGESCIDRLCNGQRLTCDDFMDLIRRGCKRVVLILLCRRNEIFFTGKNLTQGTYCGRYMLDTVDDHAFVIAEDDVGMLAHQLDDQCFMT